MITHHGYKIRKSDLTKKQESRIKKDLIVRPEAYIGFEQPYQLYSVDKEYYYLPRYYAINTLSADDIRNAKVVIFPGEKINIEIIANDFKLKPIQKVAYKSVIESFQKYSTAILKLPCGIGKTVLGIYIMAQMQRKTLIVVHRVHLMKQWREEIEKFTNAKVGMLHRKTVDVEDKDIVVTTVHNIINKKDLGDIYKKFSLSIFDEAHHLSAREFCKVLQKVSTKYMLGLTATPDKGQALMISHVFKQFIGPIVPSQKVLDKYATASANTGNVIVNVIRYQIPHDEYSQHLIVDFANKANTAGMVSNISKNPDRNNMIVHYIKQIIENNDDDAEPRKIIVASDRKYQLKYICAKLHKENISAGLFIGNLTPSEIDDVKQKTVILGTYPCVEEGLNVKELNTLIIATPRRDNEQTVGRILRKEHNIPAMIVDIIDTFSPTFSNQGTSRKRFYKSKEYEVYDQKIKSMNKLPELVYNISKNSDSD